MRGFLEKYGGGVFDPEAVTVLAAAFDDAWSRLQASHAPFAEPDYSVAARTIIAKRIIATAKRGERDQRALADDALLHIAQHRLTRTPPNN